MLPPSLAFLSTLSVSFYLLLSSILLYPTAVLGQDDASAKTCNAARHRTRPGRGSPKTNPYRMEIIKSMYAFEGFVYTVEHCPSAQKMANDFRAMKALGARVVMPTLYCIPQDDVDYYSTIIRKAQEAGLMVMPLVWTLILEDGETFNTTIVSRIHAITTAVLRNPDPVLAVALGDEPLYDWDFGAATNLAKYIYNMRSAFHASGYDIPISISELAWGYKQAQNRGENIQSVIDAVDFFMINNFPYFAQQATTGGSQRSWDDFMGDMNWYESVARGRPLVVTQTGWPSNQNLYKPNSPEIVANGNSQRGYWNLLDSHCEDYFKQKKIGWMWRAWDDTMDGWGVVTKFGAKKFDARARTHC